MGSVMLGPAGSSSKELRGSLAMGRKEGEEVKLIFDFTCVSD